MKYDPPFQRTNGFLPVMACLALLAVAPLVFTDAHSRNILILGLLYAVVASNWDLSLGFGGIFNFAHVAFFAIGLYSYGILTTLAGVNPWIALLSGMVFAVGFASLIAIPILRLDGIYVILVTFAASQLLARIIVSQSEYTGGNSGMVLLPRLVVGDFNLASDNRLGYCYAALLLLAASTTFLYKVERSATGRMIKAMRDNKYYAIARGVSEAKTRLLTLCGSAIFPAIAGGLYGSYVRVASPDVFGLGFLTIALSILLVGGTSTIWGPIMAAFAITTVSEVLADHGAWRDISIAMAIICVVVIFPGGLFAAVQEGWGVVNRQRTNLTAFLWRHFQAARRRALTGVPDALIKTSLATVSVLDTGAGDRSLILIHGNSSCKEAFFRQIPELRKHYRVVSFDLPGHGVSPNGNSHTAYSIGAFADIVHELAARLSLGTPLIFGWSMGGYIALEYAARGYPVKGLAISGTVPIGKHPDDMPRGYHPSPQMELTPKRFHSPHERREYALHTIGEEGVREPLLRQAVVRTDGLAREQVLSRLATVDWTRQTRVLQDGDVPFAMINGGRDSFINHEFCDGLPYGNIWNGKPVNFPDGSHAPFIDCSDEFNDRLLAFCRWAEASHTRAVHRRETASAPSPE